MYTYRYSPVDTSSQSFVFQRQVFVLAEVVPLSSPEMTHLHLSQYAGLVILLSFLLLCVFFFSVFLLSLCLLLLLSPLCLPRWHRSLFPFFRFLPPRRACLLPLFS